MFSGTRTAFPHQNKRGPSGVVFGWILLCQGGGHCPAVDLNMMMMMVTLTRSDEGVYTDKLWLAQFHLQISANVKFMNIRVSSSYETLRMGQCKAWKISLIYKFSQVCPHGVVVSYPHFAAVCLWVSFLVLTMHGLCLKTLAPQMSLALWKAYGLCERHFMPDKNLKSI